MWIMIALLLAAPAPAEPTIPAPAEPTIEESLGCALLAIAVRDDNQALGESADDKQRADLALATRIHAAASAKTREIVQRDGLSREATTAARDKAQAAVFDQWEQLDDSLAACAVKLGLPQS